MKDIKYKKIVFCVITYIHYSLYVYRIYFAIPLSRKPLALFRKNE